MKPVKLTIDNIACVSHLELDLTNTMVLICGDVRQGKTTALNAIKYLSSGKFPDNLIKNGETEALIRIDYDKGHIERTYYRKSGVIKARPLSVVMDGATVKKPADFVKSIAGEFVMNQDHFVSMKPEDKKQYFLNTFNVDTTEEDKTIDQAKQEAKGLRAEIKAIGTVDTTPIEKPIPVTELLNQRKEIEAKNEAAMADHLRKQKELVDSNNKNSRIIADRAAKERRLEDLREQNAKARAEAELIKAELAVPLPEGVVAEELPDAPLQIPTTSIDEQIEAASVAEEEYRAYERALEAEKLVVAKEKTVKECVAIQKKMADAKKAKITALNDTHGVEGLVFGEDGEITFLGNSLDTLSTSEQMELSNKLISLQGNDLGIVILDRAESLGASVFDFIERAKKDNLTILATYVGERPANVPEEVGVYMMENGVANGGEQPEIVEETKSIKSHEEASLTQVAKGDPIEFDFNEWKKVVAKVKPVLVTELLLGTVEFADAKNITISFEDKHRFQCGDLNKNENLKWLVDSVQLFTNTVASLVLYVKDKSAVVEETKSVEPVTIDVDEFEF